MSRYTARAARWRITRGRTLWRQGKRHEARVQWGKAGAIVRKIARHYVYLISMDYTKKGRKGKHPLHLEVLLKSPEKLARDEALKLAEELIPLQTDFLVIGWQVMKVIGMEIREGAIDEPSVEVVSWHHQELK